MSFRLIHSAFLALAPLSTLTPKILRIKIDIQRFGIKKAALTHHSNASTGMTFLKNGAKETRTPDPLHSMRLSPLPKTKS